MRTQLKAVGSNVTYIRPDASPSAAIADEGPRMIEMAKICNMCFVRPVDDDQPEVKTCVPCRKRVAHLSRESELRRRQGERLRTIFLISLVVGLLLFLAVEPQLRTIFGK